MGSTQCWPPNFQTICERVQPASLRVRLIARFAVLESSGGGMSPLILSHTPSESLLGFWCRHRDVLPFLHWAFMRRAHVKATRGRGLLTTARACTGQKASRRVLSSSSLCYWLSLAICTIEVGLPALQASSNVFHKISRVCEFDRRREFAMGPTQCWPPIYAAICPRVQSVSPRARQSLCEAGELEKYWSCSGDSRRSLILHYTSHTPHTHTHSCRVFTRKQANAETCALCLCHQSESAIAGQRPLGGDRVVSRVFTRERRGEEQTHSWGGADEWWVMTMSSAFVAREATCTSTASTRTRAARCSGSSASTRRSPT